MHLMGYEKRHIMSWNQIKQSFWASSTII